jgi:hypothetical protein
MPPMTRQYAIYALLTCLVCATNLHAAEIKTLGRNEGPVIIKGAILNPGQEPLKIKNLRLFAWKDGQMQAIPFQIDKFAIDNTPLLDLDEEQNLRLARIREFEKRKAAGTIPAAALTREERLAYHQEALELFDDNDELVFQVKDGGAQQNEPNPTEPNLTKQIEITLTDPLTSGRAWVYLRQYDQNPPYISPTDYVQFKVQSDTITSPLYILDFIDNQPLIQDVIKIGDGKGNYTSNWYDRFKFRIDFYPKMFFSIHFNEENIKSRLIGYKDGSVRVIRRAEYWVTFIGLKVSPKTVVDYYYYYDSFIGPSRSTIPFNPSALLNPGSRFYAGMDLGENAYGLKVSTPDNKDLLIDGQMDAQEQHMVLDNQPWFVLAKDGRGTVVKIVLSDELQKLHLPTRLYYLDDKAQTNPPEAEKGISIIGWQMDMLQIPKGTHDLVLYQYFSPDYQPGDAKKFLQILDNPLKISVH